MDRNATPLHALTARADEVPLREVLLLVRAAGRSPAALFGQDGDGATPLHYACSRGDDACSIDVVRFLALQDVTACFIENNDGELPYQVRGGRRSNDVAEFIANLTQEVAEAVVRPLLFSRVNVLPASVLDRTFGFMDPASVVKHFSRAEMTQLFRRPRVVAILEQYAAS